MAERLRFHGSGRVLTLRDHSPEAMAEMARAMMVQPMPRIQVDDGREIADIVARTASRASGAARASRARRPLRRG